LVPLPMGKMIFGSTARMIIMQANCPVLTVK
jgi:nucleotide-binding universal stress UspA family protein